MANQDNWARNTTGFNLTGGSNCKATAQAKIDTENNFDDFTVEFTRTPANAASWQHDVPLQRGRTGHRDRARSRRPSTGRPASSSASAWTAIT